MAFKLRSQGEGDPVGVTVGASGSSENKSVGMDVAAEKGPLTAGAAINLSPMNKMLSGSVGYSKKNFNASINAEKSLGSAASISGRVSYKF